MGSGKWNAFKRISFVDDLSKSINFIIENDINDYLINIGSGEEISILDLAQKNKENYEV